MGVIGANCQEYYSAVFSDSSDTNWCVLSYKGQTLEATGKGSGGLNELSGSFQDAEVQYAFLRMTKTDDCGDSVRTKFVFITWVGSSASPLKKGKVNLFKGFHIEKAIYERRELVGLEAELDLLLKKAGGANYDLGNTRSGIQKGNAAEYKKNTKEFFERKDKESKLGPVVFDKGPLREGLSPVDLGGRAMTVGQAQAKQNTVDDWSLQKGDKPAERPSKTLLGSGTRSDVDDAPRGSSQEVVEERREERREEVVEERREEVVVEEDAQEEVREEVVVEEEVAVEEE